MNRTLLPVTMVLTVAAYLAYCPPVSFAAEAPAAASPRQTISLDGQWSFATDPRNVGETEKWYAAATPLPHMPLPGYAPTADGRITVPGIWDVQGYGLETDKLRHNFVGKGWYRRQVTLPVPGPDRRVFLRVTGVHRYAKVWVDGRYLGEHVGYLSPFEFDITDLAGGATPVTIAIQVDSNQRWDVDGLYGAGDLADYFDAQWGGIWGHVSIEVRPATWLEDLFLQPRLSPPQCSAAATVRGTPRGASAATALRLEVLDGEGKVLAAETKPLAAPLKEGDVLDAQALLPQARCWTPDTPTLYLARLSLLDGATVVDRVEGRFGLRQIEIRGPYFYLNGKRLFLRGYGDDHIYPKELARTADKQVYLDRLRVIKSYGFNFVRHHSTIMPPEYYEACDELGMLVSAEYPIAYEEFYRKAGPAALETHRREWAAAIRQLRNHPSIFDWCMGNEFWNSLPMAGDFAAIARRLDPTRPFVDSDGLFPGILSHDRSTLDFYFLMFDVGRIPLDIPDKFRMDKPRKPVVSHETGNYVTFPRLDQFDHFAWDVKPYWTAEGIAKLKSLGLAGEAPAWAEKSERLYLFCHKNNIEALRRNPYLSGHQWWLFQDYWTTSNGIVDFLYRPKSIRPAEVRRMVDDVVLLADGLDRTRRGKGPLTLGLVVSNYSPAALDSAELTWQARLEGKEVPGGGRQAVAVCPGEVTPVAQITFDVPDVAVPSRLTIQAELTVAGGEGGTATSAGGGTTGGPAGRRYANDWTVWIYPSQPPAPGAPAPASPPSASAPAAAAPGAPASGAPALSVPVYATQDLMAMLGPCGAKPVPSAQTLDARGVYAARSADARMVDAAERGACLVILGGRGLAPTVPALFKTSWWKGSGPNDNNCGTIVYDHPVTRAMAPEGWCDAGWYSLLQGAAKFNLEALPHRPDVLIRGIPHLHLMADLAFLFEARVGKGSVLVSGLNHDAAKDRPEGQWLLAKMIEHAATLPRPTAELPAKYLRDHTPPSGDFLQGFGRFIQKGEEGVWHSYREDNIPSHVCRQTQVGNAIEWETAALPADWSAPQATFLFAGGLGWWSQPKTPGFALFVEGKEALHFDLADRPTTWTSPDGKIQFQFWPMRELPEDQLGLFYLTVPRDLLRPGQPCRLAVRSLGKDSHRWFAVDTYTDLR